MKKSSRYIAICITALFLSFSICFVSLGDTFTYVNPSLSYTADSNNIGVFVFSDSKPSRQYNDSYLIDLTVSDAPLPINKYFHAYATSTYIPRGTFYTTEDLIFDGGNYYTTTFFLVRRDNNNPCLRIRTNDYSYQHSFNQSDFNRSGNYSDDVLNLVWNSSPSVIYDGSNNYITLMVVSFGVFEIFDDNSYENLLIERFYNFQTNIPNYQEFIVPYYSYQSWTLGGDDTSEDTSSDGVDLSGIESKLDDLTQSVVDSIEATNEVRDEVSRLGDDISQFHNDLTSLPPDFDESSYQGVVDNVSSSVSDITSYEGIINDAIESNASDVANFDVSGLESYVEEGLNPLTNDTEDLAFESFLKNMYDSLGMATYFIVFAPFAIIFVLFKFVIGGIT